MNTPTPTAAPEWRKTWIGQLPALSIRQPWANFILHHGKNVENRIRRTWHRDWFLIHAALGCTKAERISAYLFAVEAGLDPYHIRNPKLEQRGGIIGMAKIVDCVRGNDHRTAHNKWFVGPWGYLLDEVTPLDFFPCNGMLGFFKLPPVANGPMV